MDQAYSGVVDQTSIWDLRSGTRLGTLGLGFFEAALGDDFAVTGDNQGKLRQ